MMGWVTDRIDGVIQALWPANDFPADYYEDVNTYGYEPDLTDAELIGVRGLLQERYADALAEAEEEVEVWDAPTDSPVPPAGDTPTPVEPSPPLAPGVGPLRDVLEEHALLTHHRYWRCSCGEPVTYLVDWADHVASVITQHQ